MTIRATTVAFLVVAGLAGANASAGECKKTAAGAPTVTGTGNGTPKDATGLSRLKAERAAMINALHQIKDCLGADAGKVTGWSITDVRYFDADPIVELDVTASFDPKAQVTVLGSGVPDLKKVALVGSTADARVKTTRAATVQAQRNAKEALDQTFPSDGESATVNQSVAGLLGGCATEQISYWDDQAVTVRLTCAKEAPTTASPEPKGQPKVETHKK